VDQVGDERLVLLRGEARTRPTRLDDATVLALDPDRRIRRIRPRFRPLAVLAARMLRAARASGYGR